MRRQLVSSGELLGVGAGVVEGVLGAAEERAGVALVMAAHESSEAGRPVTMEEVVNGSLSAYQDVADRALGLLN